ncbi:phage late control D family protein [Acinetobacter sp. CS-2]|uniref:phage late control D family protein n=1 Tax=Acinetobacter sp. CS-2 TaxID=2798861 RepID=UPI0019033EB9|nr:contractile injection system protein, VgrG/Pvc8 family [Acinetobacter sp. CS-2]QQN40426.1 hypothetical protein JFY49_05830 [Acinetobacter sp. CS-2]
MGLKPCFKVIANGSDISNVIEELFEYISVTDQTGIESDTCEISLIDDPVTPISIPPRGAEMEILMGYDDALVPMGKYIVDEIELEGPPEKMVIRGRAAAQTASKSGQVSMQTQKSRTWAKDTTIEATVRKIAKEHNLDFMVSDSLKAVKLPQTSQSDESDLSFLFRLAKRYDAICKPAGAKLLFVKRGEIQLDVLSLTRYQLSKWSMVRSSRDSTGTVIAYWHEKAKAKKHEVKLGDGEPVRRLRHAYADAASAKAGAQAALDKSKRDEDKLSITLPGDPHVSAESPVTISEIRDGINGDWIVDSVTHKIDKSVGFNTSFEAVKNLKDEE